MNHYDRLKKSRRLKSIKYWLLPTNGRHPISKELEKHPTFIRLSKTQTGTWIRVDRINVNEVLFTYEEINVLIPLRDPYHVYIAKWVFDEK